MVSRRAPEQGMTLVELMVTMVIASIVAASTFMFFAGQQRVYETQTKMLNVQQNAWAAMEVLTRFVRAEGSGMYGCVRPVGGLTPPPPPLNRTTGANPDPSDDPPVVAGVGNLSQRPNAGLRAYNAGTAQVQRVPALWIVDQEDGTDVGIVPGTDVITVAFGNQTSGSNFDSALAGVVTTTNQAISVVAGNVVMFQPAEFTILVGEPGMGGAASDIGCTLFQTTSVTDSPPDQLTHASGGTTACPPGAACSGSVWNPPVNVAGMITGTGYGVYVAGSPPQNPNTGVRNFGQFWWVRFAVRTTDANGNYLSNKGIPCQTHTIPVLTMERIDGSIPAGPQVLAEGVEDLQVAFACDLNGNGTLDEGSPPSITDEWTLNATGDPIEVSNARKCNQPSAVRVTLIARSLTEDNGINAALLDNGRPAAENHAAHTASANPSCNNPTVWDGNNYQDQFRRRVLSTTMYPRN